MFLKGFVSLAILVAVESVNLPIYVRTCSRNDPRLNACALKNGIDVIPKLMKGNVTFKVNNDTEGIAGDASIRLPSLEPLVLDRVEIRPSGGSGSVTIRLVCYNCHVIGLSGTRLLDIKVDLRKRHIDLKLVIPRLMVIGKYDVNGRVLVLPITGRGLANITLTDLQVTAGLDWKLTKRKKEEYGQFTKHKVSFTASLFKINLSNLFNGDKRLSDNMNMILNANWREVLKDLKPSISETVGEIIKLTLNRIFDIIPFVQFFPD